MNIQELYKQVKSGQINEAQFMQQLRNNPLSRQWISQYTTYLDSVKILKNKSIITENYQVNTENTFNIIKRNGEIVKNVKFTPNGKDFYIDNPKTGGRALGNIQDGDRVEKVNTNEAVAIGGDDWDEDDDEVNKPYSKYGKNPGGEAFNNLEKGKGDWRDEDTLNKYSGIGKNARFGSKDNFSLNEDEELYNQALVDIQQQIDQYDEAHGGSDSSIRQEIIDSAVGEYGLSEDEKKNLEVAIFNWLNDEYSTDNSRIELDENTVSAMQKLSHNLQIKNYDEEQVVDSIIKLRQGDELEKRRLEKEFPGLQQDILALYGVSRVNELEHIQWNTISEKDAKNLKDHYDRTGRLPYGLTPQQYQEIIKKHNLSTKSINERKNPIKGGKGDKLNIDEVNPTELSMGVKVEMEHTKDKNKAIDIAMDHLAEDPIYYTKLKMAGLADELKEPKKAKSSVPTLLNKKLTNVVDKENGLKPVKGVVKVKQSAKNSTKETVKPVKGIQIMSQTPKKAKGITKTMELPKKSKEIQLKETIDKLVAKVIKECQCQNVNENSNELKVGDSVKINHPKQHTGVIKSIEGDRAVVRGDNGENWNVNLNQLTKTQKSVFSLNRNNPRAGGNMMDMIKEEKASEFKAGQKFTMTSDLGNFKKGDEVTVNKVVPMGNDIEVHLQSGDKKDVFYLDKEDTI